MTLKGQNAIHPMWTFLVAFSSWLVNLRDSTSEDNVRKRPFSTKVWPANPCRLFESVANIQKRKQSCIYLSNYFWKKSLFSKKCGQTIDYTEYFWSKWKHNDQDIARRYYGHRRKSRPTAESYCVRWPSVFRSDDQVLSYINNKLTITAKDLTQISYWHKNQIICKTLCLWVNKNLNNPFIDFNLFQIIVCRWCWLIVSKLPSVITSTTRRISCFEINESKNTDFFEI